MPICREGAIAREEVWTLQDKSMREGDCIKCARDTMVQQCIVWRNQNANSETPEAHREVVAFINLGVSKDGH